MTSELQATLEFCVELHKFYNVDLFLRGYYQLALSLRVCNNKLPVRIEINNRRDDPPSLPPSLPPSSQPPLQQPPTPQQKTTETENSVTTKQFRILFRNEELELKEIFLFRVHYQQELTNSMAMPKLIEELSKVEYFLDLKLCFNDNVVSSRTCQIHYYLSNSVHYYRNVFFDYFHLCAVSLSVHGGAVAVHISKGTLMNCNSKPDLIPNSSSTPNVSCLPSSSSSIVNQNRFLATAKKTHDAILNVLIESNSSLKTKLVEFLQVLGKHELVEGLKGGIIKNEQQVDFDAFLRGGEGKTTEEITDFLLKAHKQIAHLCAENILLWHRFLDLIISKDPVRVYLANLHHQLRVKRFSEGFYITTNPLRSAYTSKDYTPIVELLKKSINYSPLPIECIEIDGDSTSIPIVFEDQFLKEEGSPPCPCTCSKLKSKSQTDLKALNPADLTLKLHTLKKSSKSKSTHTLPRRHSHSHSRKKLCKFASTPFLNESSPPTPPSPTSSTKSTSSESGWMSESDSESLVLLPPPKEFRDEPAPSSTKAKEKKPQTTQIPYFLIPDELRIFHPKGLHLIICVHGLDGSCHDLRLFKIYLEVSLPGHNVQFLMSEKNQDGTTFTNFNNMTEKLIKEILNYMETNKLNPARISFVGHSLGNIIIRSALASPSLEHLLPKLWTFLSLSGPHLGTLYNAGIVNMGMWLMQKWKKSSSLLQLQLRDHPDIRKTFMYKLSEKSILDKFKHVLLCGSSQDRYVPVHSAHVINCKASLKDQGSQGEAYREMVMNILNPILTNQTTKLIRYDVHHAINPHTANSLIGRAAHIAVLDSEIFIEKFLCVSGVRYFV